MRSEVSKEIVASMLKELTQLEEVTPETLNQSPKVLLSREGSKSGIGRKLRRVSKKGM